MGSYQAAHGVSDYSYRGINAESAKQSYYMFTMLRDVIVTPPWCRRLAKAQKIWGYDFPFSVQKLDQWRPHLMTVC
jgi:hypothetical protein